MNNQPPHADNTAIVASTLDDLSERFEVSLDRVDGDGRPALEIFREMLAARLRQIIDHQFSRLAPLLYRIDVDERRVDEIMRHAPFSEVPTRLADLIIERRLQAMETRARYREEARRVGEGESGGAGETGIVYDELPGWSFDVDEVSAGVYRACGKDSSGRSVEAKGTEPDELLQWCYTSALEMEKKEANPENGVS